MREHCPGDRRRCRRSTALNERFAESDFHVRRQPPGSAGRAAERVAGGLQARDDAGQRGQCLLPVGPAAVVQQDDRTRSDGAQHGADDGVDAGFAPVQRVDPPGQRDRPGSLSGLQHGPTRIPESTLRCPEVPGGDAGRGLNRLLSGRNLPIDGLGRQCVEPRRVIPAVIAQGVPLGSDSLGQRRDSRPPSVRQRRRWPEPRPRRADRAPGRWRGRARRRTSDRRPCRRLASRARWRTAVSPRPRAVRRPVCGCGGRWCRGRRRFDSRGGGGRVHRRRSGRRGGIARR